MTEPDADYGDRLRRELRAAVEGITPSPGGLDRIRERIARQRSRSAAAALLAWLAAALSDFRHLVGALRAALPPVPPAISRLKLGAVAALASALAVTRSAVLAGWGKAAPAATSAARATVAWAGPRLRAAVSAAGSAVPGRLRLGNEWIRPLLATGGAVLVAAVALFAIPGLRQTVIPTSNVNAPPKPQQNPPGAALGNGTRSPGSAGPTTSRAPVPAKSKPSRALVRTGSSKPCPTNTARTTATPAPSCPRTSPPVSVTTPATAGPTSTTTATPTVTPSPTPSETPTTPAAQNSSSLTGSP